MKCRNFLGLALVAGLLAVGVAQAQVVPPTTELTVLSVTNDVPNNSTTTANLGAELDVSQFENVGVLVKYALNGSGTTACTFTFNWSADGTNYNTTSPFAIALAPAGTTAVTTNALWHVGAMRKVKLSGLTAANNSAAMTNITVMFVRKPYPKDY